MHSKEGEIIDFVGHPRETEERRRGAERVKNAVWGPCWCGPLTNAWGFGLETGRELLTFRDHEVEVRQKALRGHCF